MDNPTIKIVSKELKGKTFKLTKDQYLVGRTEECDICIQNSAVSSRHCTLTREESGNYLLTDLNSTNGTVVNGRKTQEKVLQNSDIIRIGSIEIIYESPVTSGKNKEANASSSYHKNADLRETAGTSQITDFTNFSPFSSNKSNIDRGISRNLALIGIALFTGLALTIAVVLLYFFTDLL